MELEPTRIFVKVVELGSFTRAADVLRLPKSTVSRAVSRLEAESGTKLLLRTTRSLKLTPAGEAFFESSAGPVRALEDARKALQDKDSQVTGVVRLTAPEDLGSLIVSDVLGKIARAHPGLSIDFDYSDELIDLVKEGYDLAVRVGPLSPSRFKAIKLGEVSFILVASRRYLERAPKVSEPKDLASHDCLLFNPEGTNRWDLTSKKGRASVPVRARISGNHARSLARLAASDGGVAFLPRVVCDEALGSGKLVRVLPEWSGLKVPVYLVSPITTAFPRRLKIVIDALVPMVRSLLGE